MTSSAYHKHCTVHLELAKGNMAQLKFTEAAKELLLADKFAVHAVDMYMCEVLRSELIDVHGVNWNRVVTENRALS